MRSEVCCSSSLVDFLAKERKSFDFLWLACFLLDHFAQHTLTLAITHRVKASSKSELSNSVAISSFTVRGSRDFDKETAVGLFAFETWWCPPSILGLTVHHKEKDLKEADLQEAPNCRRCRLPTVGRRRLTSYQPQMLIVNRGWGRRTILGLLFLK